MMIEGRWMRVQALVAFVGLSLFGTLPAAFAADESPVAAHHVVAAGFGFQNADSSSITVKTYDADTGEVLSDDTYELDIKEEVSATMGQPRERVFAGGVGLGADGLSEFTLRVYDAVDGRFLWEGRLNLGVSSPSEGLAVRVSAQVRPRLMLRQVSQSEPHGAQPFFFLRAVDAETGQVMWADQFSTDGIGSVRAERIAQALEGDSIDLPNFDFRIRMFDESTRLLLWEDRVTAESASEEVSTGPAGEAAAGMIPGSATVKETGSADI